ncbi:hypothetical protein ACLMJK_003725 [Lecanora helva]
MQTVWSRAAQARCLCKCPTCTATTKALTRRTTSATPKRAIRVGSASTVFASSLAVGAAFLDTVNKDARRLQWDKVIGEARAQVQATEAQQQSRLASLIEASEGEKCEEQDELSSLGTNHLSRLVPRYPQLRHTQDTLYGWADVFDWAARQDEIRVACGFQDWRGPSLSLLQSFSPDQLQQLRTNDVLIRRFYGGPDCGALVEEISVKDLSLKKTKTLEYSVARLVLKLLLYSSAIPSESKGRVSDTGVSRTPSTDDKIIRDDEKDTHPKGPAITERDLEICSAKEPSDMSMANKERGVLQQLLSYKVGVAQRLYELKKRLRDLTERPATDEAYFENFESLAIPRYSNKTAAKWDEAQALNRVLKEILISMQNDKDPASLLPKICFNLMTYNTPPNIHSYNMLLITFCQLNQYNWVRAVLASMRESHIRPNEITHSTLLRYYTVTKKSHAFIHYLRLMAGHKQGLALAAPDQVISSLSSHRYRFFGKNNSKAAEKARMNGEVYESMILGALRFFGVNAAMRCYRDMVNEGWKASLDLLTIILQHCYHRFDWEGGVSVWDRIAATAEGARQSTYKWMLFLCLACRQQDAFRQVLHEGVAQGILPYAMLKMPTAAEKDTITDYLGDDGFPIFGGYKEVQVAASASSGTDLQVEQLPRIRSHCTQILKAGMSSRQIARKARMNTWRKKLAKKYARKHTKNHVASPFYRPVSRHYFIEQRLDALALSISDVTTEVQMQQNRPTLDSPDLSEKIKKWNRVDTQKMNSVEYQRYYNETRDRLPKTGQLLSRNIYETYRSNVVSKLEEEDGVIHDTWSNRADTPKNNQDSYTPDGDHGSESRDSRNPLLRTPPGIPHPTTWTDLDRPFPQASPR